MDWIGAATAVGTVGTACVAVYELRMLRKERAEYAERELVERILVPLRKDLEAAVERDHEGAPEFNHWSTVKREVPHIAVRLAQDFYANLDVLESIARNLRAMQHGVVAAAERIAVEEAAGIWGGNPSTDVRTYFGIRVNGRDAYGYSAFGAWVARSDPIAWLRRRAEHTGALSWEMTVIYQGTHVGEEHVSRLFSRAALRWEGDETLRSYRDGMQKFNAAAVSALERVNARIAKKPRS